MASSVGGGGGVDGGVGVGLIDVAGRELGGVPAGVLEMVAKLFKVGWCGAAVGAFLRWAGGEVEEVPVPNCNGRVGAVFGAA